MISGYSIAFLLSAVAGAINAGPPLHPVFFMHGIDGAASDWDAAIAAINITNPGTFMYAFSNYEGDPDSFTKLDTQISGVSKTLLKVVSENEEIMSDGYNLVCHSQGALLCRCLIEYMSDHQIRHFVSLAGPQEGVYGWDFLMQIGFFKKFPWIINFTMEESHNILYSAIMQELSFGNMWQDPFYQDEYEKYNKFLPKYNGLTASADDLATYKANFMRLHTATFYTGTFNDTEYDGGIEPFQSGNFGYYKTNSNTTFLTMKDRDAYMNDRFGLKSLDDAGNLTVISVPNVPHNTWRSAEYTVKYVVPILD